MNAVLLNLILTSSQNLCLYATIAAVIQINVRVYANKYLFKSIQPKYKYIFMRCEFGRNKFTKHTK